jgi:hypothetical protein
MLKSLFVCLSKDLIYFRKFIIFFCFVFDSIYFRVLEIVLDTFVWWRATIITVLAILD